MVLRLTLDWIPWKIDITYFHVYRPNKTASCMYIIIKLYVECLIRFVAAGTTRKNHYSNTDVYISHHISFLGEIPHLLLKHRMYFILHLFFVSNCNTYSSTNLECIHGGRAFKARPTCVHALLGHRWGFAHENYMV